MKNMILAASAIAVALTAAMVFAAPRSVTADGSSNAAPNRAEAYLIASAD